MCLAEALLRIPDAETVDQLIRDKIAAADWERPSRPFRIAVRQRLDLGADADRTAVAARPHRAGRRRSRGRSAPLCRAVERAGVAPGGDRRDAHPGRPVRHGTHDRRGAGARPRGRAARLPPFLRHARRGGPHDAGRGALPRRLRGRDRARSARRRAASASRRPPAFRSSCRRCTRATRWRSANASMRELLPSLLGLARQARDAGIGFTIDAEEADRLELSLDLVEALALAPELAGWDGLGLAVQAYQKRALPLLDWLADLAAAGAPPADGAAGQGRLLGHRDQTGAGARPRRLSGVHPQGRDRCLATSPAPNGCSRRRPAFYPQFATHNAHTVAAVLEMAGDRTRLGIPAAARHGRGALRRDRRPRQAGPAVPGLRAGRQPRGSARLSGAAAARERRQHVVRQPHRRRARADRRDHRRSGRSARAPAAQAAPGHSAAARPLPSRSGATRRASTSRTRAACPSCASGLAAAARRPWTRRADRRRHRADRNGGAGLRSRRPPSGARQGRRMRGRMRSRTRSSAPRRRRRRGTAPRRRRGQRRWSARPTATSATGPS